MDSWPGLGQPEIRDKIQKGWELTHLREMMGLADVLSALWGECDDESGMHFCGQRAVAVELVDPATGKQIPWEDGASGEVVYTTFARQATPMLRFRSPMDSFPSTRENPIAKCKRGCLRLRRSEQFLLLKT